MKTNYLKNELDQRLREDNQILDFIQKGSLDGIWYLDLTNMDDEWMSERFWETLGYDPAQKKHKVEEWKNIIFDDDLEIAMDEMQRHIEDPSYPYDVVVRYHHKNGSTVWIRCRGIAIRDENNQATRMLGSHIDITKIKKTTDALHSIKEEYETVFNGTQDALFLMEVLGAGQFRFIRSNQAHQQKTGITLAMIAGKTPQELLGKEGGDLVSLNYQRCVDSKEAIHYEEVLDLPGGKRTWYTTLSPIIIAGKVVNIVGSATDITDRKALEKELEYRANYDSLSGLAKREFFYKKLQEAIQYANDLHCHFALAYIDLDKFKEINDAYGHRTGDNVLIEVSNRIKKAIGPKDFAARLGGDEFAVIVCATASKQYITSLKNALEKAIKTPINIDNTTHHIGVSIGIAHYPQHGTNYEDLLHHADQEMYKNKNK